jgi:amino acid transporter
MFERFKSRSSDANGANGHGGTAVADRPARDRTAETAVGDRPTTTRPAPAREHLHAARSRQREEYGGINWGAAFFGWLVAVGLGSLLIAVVAAAGAAVGLTQVSGAEAEQNAETIGLGGAIALLAVLMIAYYCGGYVAGRMSRFDGARQGFGSWLFGIAVTLLLALAAVILGSEYNVLEQLNLPSLPVGESTMTTGGAIALAAVLIGTLLAAIVGGKAGERYHRKVDRVGFAD